MHHAALIDLLGIHFTRWLFFSQGAVVGAYWGLFGAGMGLTLAAMPFWPRGLDVLGVCCFVMG